MAGAARALVRRALFGGLVVNLGVLVVGARPAAADAARPTNYRSTVTAVRPATRTTRVEPVAGVSGIRFGGS